MSKPTKPSLSHKQSSTAPSRAPAVKAHDRHPRGQATIAAILEGATQVLVSEGLRGFNSNRIAAAAGVNIGSFYQYFANKEEVAQRLVESQYQDIRQIIQDGIGKFTGGSVLDTVDFVISSVITTLSRDQGLFFVLREQLSGTEAAVRLNQVFDDMINLLHKAFALKANDFASPPPPRAAFIIVNAIDGVLTAASRQAPSNADYEELRRDLVSLVVRYLESPAKA